MFLTINTDSFPVKHRSTVFLSSTNFVLCEMRNMHISFQKDNSLILSVRCSLTCSCVGKWSLKTLFHSHMPSQSAHYCCPHISSTDVFWTQDKALATRWRGGCRTPLPTTPTRPTEASLTALSRLIINLFLPGGEALKLFNFLRRYVPWDLRSQAEIKKYGCICEGLQARDLRFRG